jgi:uncharacterized protein (TIGR02300 family)
MRQESPLCGRSAWAPEGQRDAAPTTAHSPPSRDPRIADPHRNATIDSGASTSQVKHRFFESPPIFQDQHVAKPELGTKRICPTTGKKFYDLNKNPVISPYTGEIVPIVAPVAARTRGSSAAVNTESAAEPAEMETISLEEADAEENTGKVKADLPESEDDIEVDETLDDDDDDSTFIADEEEEDDDVTDIIGDVSDDEET